MGLHSADHPAKRLRRRRVRALLASGLVLGVGAAATLAAWNDSEYSRATFTAGTFGIQGSTDGATFTENPSSSSPATLTFSVPPTALAPGQTVYAQYSIRTAAGSVPGTVQLTANSGNSSGLGQWLRYGVRTIANTQVCNQTSFNASTTIIVPGAGESGSPLTTGASTQQALQANAANRVNYCFAFTLPLSTPNGAQGQTLTANWQFTGTSTAP